MESFLQSPFPALHVGVIGVLSEVGVEWKISNIFSLFRDANSIQSPFFAFSGYVCCMTLAVFDFPNPDDGRVYITIFIGDFKNTDKTVTYTFGLRKADGSLEELPGILIGDYAQKEYEFRRICCRWRPDDLRRRQSELVPSGTLTVTFRMEDETRSAEVVASKPQEMESQQRMLVDLETLSSDFKDLFISERKCDVTVNVQGKDFKAHRAVLSARSSVFRAMYDHDTAEEETGALKIPDCDPGTFGEFLRYLYTGKMEEMSFQTAYHLYTTADKYDVQRMKSFCADYLKQNLTAQNVCEVVVLADCHSDDELMSSAQVFFNKNFRRVLLTSEWKALLSSSLRLSNKLLEAMAASDLENPSKT